MEYLSVIVQIKCFCFIKVLKVEQPFALNVATSSFSRVLRD